MIFTLFLQELLLYWFDKELLSRYMLDWVETSAQEIDIQILEFIEPVQL